jgi:hypothetical protein
LYIYAIACRAAANALELFLDTPHSGNGPVANISPGQITMIGLNTIVQILNLAIFQAFPNFFQLRHMNAGLV